MVQALNYAPYIPYSSHKNVFVIIIQSNLGSPNCMVGEALPPQPRLWSASTGALVAQQPVQPRVCFGALWPHKMPIYQLGVFGLIKSP